MNDEGDKVIQQQSPVKNGEIQGDLEQFAANAQKNVNRTFYR